MGIFKEKLTVIAVPPREAGESSVVAVVVKTAVDNAVTVAKLNFAVTAVGLVVLRYEGATSCEIDGTVFFPNR